MMFINVVEFGFHTPHKLHALRILFPLSRVPEHVPLLAAYWLADLTTRL
jgi:hypothetical protein